MERKKLNRNVGKSSPPPGPLPAVENHQSKQNPLENDLILKNIFTILKGSDNAKCLGRYRSVCKYWDEEIAKLIRNETQIQLSRIVAPYPDGMGWTALDNSIEYKVPYPEVYTFKNIVVDLRPEDYEHLDSDNSSNDSVSSSSDSSDSSDDDDIDCSLQNKLHDIMVAHMEEWFERMGSDVRSLHISISASSPHYKIMERILQEWCPNLESLTLIGIDLDTLIYGSEFTDMSRGLICNGLETLQIGKKQVPSEYPNGHRPEDEYYPNIGFDVNKFNEFVYHHGILAEPQVIEVEDIELVVSEKEFPDFSQFLPDAFFPEDHDGGILGQLMKSTKLEKLILYSLPLHLNQMAGLFHYRPNQWRTSLQQLEFGGNYPLHSLDSLIVLTKLYCPITTLTFPDLHFDDETENKRLARFLSYLAGTLEHLFFTGECINWGSKTGRIELPLLPKLKTFQHNNICLSNLPATHLFEKAPNLERCYLRWHPFCDSLATKAFFQDKNVPECEQMKTFKFSGNGKATGEEACSILSWFPNLETLELSVEDQDNKIIEFIRKLSDSKIKYLSFNWARSLDEGRDLDANAVIIREISKLKKLVTLELGHYPWYPCRLKQIAFVEGFEELTELIVLKLRNYGIYIDEETEILSCLSHIPVVEFIKTTYLRRPSARRK